MFACCVLDRRRRLRPQLCKLMVVHALQYTTAETLRGKLMQAVRGVGGFDEAAAAN
jgi:hypothetical protein